MEATTNETSTLVFVFEDKEQTVAHAGAEAEVTEQPERTRSQKHTDYYAEKARNEFEQLLEARKSQKEGRWADPIVRRLIVEIVHSRTYDRNIPNKPFNEWIISNKDEDGDYLFDNIYAAKNEYCVHNSKVFMYKQWTFSDMGIKFTDCIVLKNINAEYLPLYAKCDIEVFNDFLVRFYQDDKYIIARELIFK
jgi:hypothetical protein